MEALLTVEEKQALWEHLIKLHNDEVQDPAARAVETNPALSFRKVYQSLANTFWKEAKKTYDAVAVEELREKMKNDRYIEQRRKKTTTSRNGTIDDERNGTTDDKLNGSTDDELMDEEFFECSAWNEESSTKMTSKYSPQSMVCLIILSVVACFFFFSNVHTYDTIGTTYDSLTKTFLNTLNLTEGSVYKELFHTKKSAAMDLTGPKIPAFIYLIHAKERSLLMKERTLMDLIDAHFMDQDIKERARMDLIDTKVSAIMEIISTKEHASKNDWKLFCIVLAVALLIITTLGFKLCSVQKNLLKATRDADCLKKLYFDSAWKYSTDCIPKNNLKPCLKLTSKYSTSYISDVDNVG